MTTNNEEKSKCCGVKVQVSMTDEGTCCYICSKCNYPCDVVFNEEKIIKEIMESEPMKRVSSIEQTAIVTGRVDQYYGKTIPEVLKEALYSQRLQLIEEVEERFSMEMMDYNFDISQVKALLSTMKNGDGIK